MSQKQDLEKLFTVENNKYLQTFINRNSAKFPVFNDKATTYEATSYVGLGLKKYNSGTWLIGLKGGYYFFSPENAAPEGTLVYFYYSTGSHKHRYNKYEQWFVVREGGRRKVLLKDLIGNVDVEVEVMNLVPVEEPTEEELGRVNTELLNRGWKLSNYDPVNVLYYFWFIRQVAGPPVVKNQPQVPQGLERVFITIGSSGSARISLEAPQESGLAVLEAFVKREDLERLRQVLGLQQSPG